jgi:uncharacterized membrane protein YvbJ
LRICPDCGARELDKRYRYCADCGEARRYISGVMKRHTWNVKNPGYKAPCEFTEERKKYKKEWKQKNGRI